MGDPAGIGPEVILKAAAALAPSVRARLLVIGDPGVMRAAARALQGVPEPVAWPAGRALPAAGEALAVFEASHLPVHATVPGKPNEAGADAAYRYIRTAAEMALKGQAAAMVTAPISKEWLNRAGHDFPGHSELLAEMARVRRWRMMFAAGRLRAALVTVHIGLARVPGALSETAVFDTIELLADNLREEAIARPSIAVLGLNPHAGEDGLFGSEETRIIEPAIARARSLGINVTGPLPPDTAFVGAAGRPRFDGFIAMYHDQGLIPVKMVAFDRAVNVTLGLPFIRTSPDHGTAYDIAGQGKARPHSMIAAIRFAARAAARRHPLPSEAA